MLSAVVDNEGRLCTCVFYMESCVCMTQCTGALTLTHMLFDHLLFGGDPPLSGSLHIPCSIVIDGSTEFSGMDLH